MGLHQTRVVRWLLLCLHGGPARLARPLCRIEDTTCIINTTHASNNDPNYPVSPRGEMPGCRNVSSSNEKLPHVVSKPMLALLWPRQEKTAEILHEFIKLALRKWTRSLLPPPLLVAAQHTSVTTATRPLPPPTKGAKQIIKQLRLASGRHDIAHIAVTKS